MILFLDDYVSLVVFNDNARVVFSIEQVAQLSMEKVKYDLDLLSAKGSTNMVPCCLFNFCLVVNDHFD